MCAYVAPHQRFAFQAHVALRVLHKDFAWSLGGLHGNPAAGSSFRSSSMQKSPELYSNRGADAGSGDWREHGHIQPGEFVPAQASGGGQSGTDHHAWLSPEQHAVGGLFSWPEYKEIRAESGNSFSDIMASTIGQDGFATEGRQPEGITTGYVSGNYWLCEWELL
jgi:hypothetical protein